MAKPALLLLLFVAFWTALTAIFILAVERSVQAWAREQLWQDAIDYFVIVLSPFAVLMLLPALVAGLSWLWDNNTARPGPSDLDRLLQVKRAGLWRLRFPAVGTACRPPSSITPLPASTGIRATTPQAAALDRLVAVKRERGYYPTALSAHEID